VQDALVEAVRVWPDDPPRDPKAWLVTVALAEVPRRRPRRLPPGGTREVGVEGEPPPGPGEGADDTLQACTSCARTRP